MYLQPDKIAEEICKQLSNKGKLDLPRLEKIYELTLRLRSQIIAVIYELKQHEYGKTPHSNRSVSQTHSAQKRIVTLTIPEPLPGRRELTSDVEHHWETMIHGAIAKEAETGIPKWEKAHVQIEIVTARGTNNQKVWDTSNRAINVVINFLKGIFFKDDDFEHLSCGIEARWGEIGETKIHICAFEDRCNPEIWGQKQENP